MMTMTLNLKTIMIINMKQYCEHLSVVSCLDAEPETKKKWGELKTEVKKHRLESPATVKDQRLAPSHPLGALGQAVIR